MLQLDPAELLRETIEGFDIETDLDTIDRINENLRVLQNEREENLNIEQQELKNLSDKLIQDSQALESLQSSTNRSDIKQNFKKNQSLELSMNKTLKELTSQKQDLSTSLSNLVDDYNSLEKQIEDLEDLKTLEDYEEKNSNTLKLMIYNRFNILLKTNKKELIIYNKEQNFNDYLNFGDEKLSDFFISNYIWNKI